MSLINKQYSVIEPGTGKLENRGHAEFIKNLDDLPKPAYHLIDFLSYYNKPQIRNSIERPKNFPYVRIITSRGCPEKCSDIYLSHLCVCFGCFATDFWCLPNIYTNSSTRADRCRRQSSAGYLSYFLNQFSVYIVAHHLFVVRVFS